MYQVSVLIPAFNAEDSIERAVRSVEDQTWTGDIEIVVCDDGSTDRTQEVVKGLQRHNQRIVLVANEGNRGRPATRNHLLRAAKGDLITWLDADDVKYPDMIRLQVDKFFKARRARGHERFLIFTNYDWDFPGRREVKLVAPSVTKDPVKALLDGSFGAYLWITLGKRSALAHGLPFDESLPRLQDLDVFLRCAGAGIEFHKVDSEAALCKYNKEDRGRNSAEVERCFAIIRQKHRYLIDLYDQKYGAELRHKHLGVAARFAHSNGDFIRAHGYAFKRSVARQISNWLPR